MPASFEELMSLLDSLSIRTTTVSHPPLHTVADSQKLRGEIAGGHIKNLFVKDKKGALFLITLEEDATVDLKTIHTLIGASGRVSFCNAEQLLAHLGVVPGAVTPFGLINDRNRAVTMVFDESLLAHDVINAHPLVNDRTTAIGRDDLLRFVRATGHEPRVLKVSA